MGCGLSQEEIIKNTHTHVIKISEAEKVLETGDILLGHASGIFSEIIEGCSRSPWSHVGMIVKEPKYQNGETLIWETTRDVEHKDIIRNKYITGVSLAPLRDKLAYYEGEYVAFRKLHVSPFVREIIKKRLPHIIKEFDGKQYDTSIIHFWVCQKGGMFGSDLVRGNPNNKKDVPRNVFCSEMIAYTYAYLGLLDIYQKPPMEYAPQDFSCSGNLQLPYNCYLDIPIFVELPHLDRIKDHRCSSTIIEGDDLVII